MCRLHAVLLIVMAFPAYTADFSARVVGIADGETLTVVTADKKPVKLRL